MSENPREPISCRDAMLEARASLDHADAAALEVGSEQWALVTATIAEGFALLAIAAAIRESGQ
jgi:hypothetical protein